MWQGLRSVGRLGYVPVVLVVVVGAVLSVLAGVALRGSERAAAEQLMDRRTDAMRSRVESEARRYVDAVQTSAAALRVEPVLTRDGFLAATEPLRSMGLHGATSVGFIVPATDEQVPAVQGYWRRRGEPALTLHPVGTGLEHLFGIMVRTLDNHPVGAEGVDVSQLGAPAEAMNEARRTGRVAVSDTYLLLRDRSLVPSRRQLSFLMAAPVYGLGSGGRAGTFRGWVVMALHGQDFIGQTLRENAHSDIALRLLAADPNGGRIQVATLAGEVHHADLHRRVEVAVAQRQWLLDLDANSSALAGFGAHRAVGAVLTLGVMTLLLAALVLVLVLARGRAEARVRSATAQLRQAEQQAREQADLLSSIVDSISDGVRVIDEDGRFLLNNPAATTLLGLDRADGPYPLHRPDGTPFPHSELPMRRALDGESTDQVEMLVRTPDGDVVISVSGRPLRYGAGRRGAVAVVHDVTDRRRTEAQMSATNLELARSLAWLSAAQVDLRATRDALANQSTYLVEVMDTLGVAVTTCDINGKVVHRNRAARRMSDAPEDASDLSTLTRGVHLTGVDGGRVSTEDIPMCRALAGACIDGEALILVRDGEPVRHLLVDARPLHDAAGTIIGAVTCAIDVTPLREHEAELHTFAGVVAHDLKSPLTAITGYGDIAVEALSSAAPDVPTALSSVERVIAGTTRMRTLIDDLLMYATARDSALRAAPTGLRSIVDDVVTSRADRPVSPAGTEPQIYVGPLPTVYADPVLLRHLVDNLVGNAIKYTPPGQPARIDITAQPAQPGWTRIEVADRGIGIPTGQHRAIFDSFHRGHPTAGYSGTGLGLAICQRVVERHGGTIGVTDNPGGGSRFSFTLPTAPAAPHPPPRVLSTVDGQRSRP